MAGEDRDRLFEKALAQHLRADGAAARASTCLDAETLAAYRERQLSPQEMSAAQEHLVSCLRCQEIVAQLESAKDLDVPNAEHRAVDTRAASALKSSGLAEKSSAAVADTKPIAEIQSKGKVANFPTKRNSPLRWAAPAGALAAGLLLWIGMRDFRAQRKPAAEPTQMAENRSEASRDSRENYVAPRTPQLSDKEKSDTVARKGQEKRNAPEQGDALEEKAGSRRYDEVLHDDMQSSKPASRSLERQSEDKKAAAPAPPPVRRPAESKSSASSAGFGGAQGKPTPKSENAERAAGSAKLDSVQVARGQTNQTKQQNVVGGIAPPPKGQTQQAAPAAAPMSSNESVTVESQALKKDSDLPMMSRTAVSNLGSLPFVASAENGKNIWRFGEHGSIVKSSDGGKTWKSQTAVVGVTLNSGSAPSKKICWIAGAAGTLLRTEDGGKHWQLVTTPISADLGGVVATDAKHASIWDAGHRLSYETFDGGATWRQIGKE
jgi:hypothetical protein